MSGAIPSPGLLGLHGVNSCTALRRFEDAEWVLLLELIPGYPGKKGEKSRITHMAELRGLECLGWFKFLFSSLFLFELFGLCGWKREAVNPQG